MDFDATRMERIRNRTFRDPQINEYIRQNNVQAAVQRVRELATLPAPTMEELITDDLTDQQRDQNDAFLAVQLINIVDSSEERTREVQEAAQRGEIPYR